MLPEAWLVLLWLCHRPRPEGPFRKMIRHLSLPANSIPRRVFSVLGPKALEFTELIQADVKLRKINTRPGMIDHHIWPFYILLTPTAA
jgi:hypothetical protein